MQLLCVGFKKAHILHVNNSGKFLILCLLSEKWVCGKRRNKILCYCANMHSHTECALVVFACMASYSLPLISSLSEAVEFWIIHVKTLWMEPKRKVPSIFYPRECWLTLSFDFSMCTLSTLEFLEILRGWHHRMTQEYDIELSHNRQIRSFQWCQQVLALLLPSIRDSKAFRMYV